MCPDVGSPSVLLSFTAENARSYRDEVHLSLLGSQFAEDGVIREVPMAGSGRLVRVLPAAGVFGANASGKTALLRVMHDLRTAVLGSFGPSGAGASVAWQPFRLDAASAVEPTRYDVDLIADGVRWQYGVEVGQAVISEYAYSFPKGRQALLFRRDSGGIEFGPAMRPMREVLNAFVRSQTLVLSTVGGFDDPGLHPLMPLYRWFERNLVLVGADSREVRLAHLAHKLDDPGRRGRAMALMRAADLGITDIEIVETELDADTRDRMGAIMSLMLGPDSPGPSPEDIPALQSIRLTHCGRDDEVSLELEDESQGTIMWLGLASTVLDALAGGHALLVDELDASLHPDLVRRVVEMFQSSSRNPHAAQLIFNAHEVELLGDTEERSIGRDQIWLASKGTDGATDLRQLVDYRPRKDVSLRRAYLQGRYGGVPELHPDAFADPAAASA